MDKKKNKEVLAPVLSVEDVVIENVDLITAIPEIEDLENFEQSEAIENAEKIMDENTKSQKLYHKKGLKKEDANIQYINFEGATWFYSALRSNRPILEPVNGNFSTKVIEIKNNRAKIKIKDFENPVWVDFKKEALSKKPLYEDR